MDEMAIIRRAREAVARGDPAAARQLLVGLLHEQPHSETAWMMMATLIEQPDHKRDCLARVLRLNPGNDAARAQLAALEAPEPTPPPETEAAADALLAAQAEPVAETLSPAEAGEEGAPQAALEPRLAELEAAATPLVRGMPEVEAGAVQEAEGEVVSPAPPAMEPALEADTVLSLQPAAEPAPVTDEADIVLGNSLLTNSLAPGERVLRRTTLTPWAFLGPLAAVLAAVIVVSLPDGSLPEGVALAYRAVLLVLAFAYFGLRAIRYFGSEYVVTDRRVLAQCGFLARVKVDIPLREIEEVTLERGSGRAGSLRVRRVGGAQVVFWRVREPGAFADAIERGRATVSETSETRSF